MITIFVEKSVAQERYNKCKNCENFSKITTMCRECHCIMKLKVTLKDSVCPINKW
jgi:hypothetical protein